jgi:hypothetical protein
MNYVNRRATVQHHRDASGHQCFIFLPGTAPNDTDVILSETLGEHVSSCDTVKSWVAQFKLIDFSTCNVPRLGRPKTVTNW